MPAITCDPGAQRVQVDLVGSFPEDPHVAVGACGGAGRALGAPGGAGSGRGPIPGGAAAPSASPETVAPSDTGERGCAPAVAGPLGAGSAAPPGRAIRALTARVLVRHEHRIQRRHLAELRVDVGVAVGVAQRDEPPERGRVADLHDFAVLHRDHRRAGLRVDGRADERLRGPAPRSRAPSGSRR